MSLQLLDYLFQRIPDIESATFEEEEGSVRGLRLIIMETLASLAAQYSGQQASSLGRGEMGDKVEIAGFAFEFEPGRQGWVFEGQQNTIVLRDTCHP